MLKNHLNEEVNKTLALFEKKKELETDNIFFQRIKGKLGNKEKKYSHVFDFTILKLVFLFVCLIFTVLSFLQIKNIPNESSVYTDSFPNQLSKQYYLENDSYISLTNQ